MPRKSGVAEPSRGHKQTITFGMVSIPVKVKNLKESKSKTSISANYICNDHQEQMKQRYYCESGDHYPDKVKAFPTESGFVQLDDDLVADVIASKTGELRIDKFVELSQIDPIYFSDAFEVFPEQQAASVYDLFAQALRDAGVAAVANAVIGGAKATKLVVLRWSDAAGCLVAHTCLYDSQIRWGDLEMISNAMASRPAPPQQQIELAQQIIDGLKGDFDSSEAEDTYRQALEDLVAQAAAGKPLAAPTAKAEPVTPADDLVGALLNSIEQQKAKPKAKKPAAKKAAKR